MLVCISTDVGASNESAAAGAERGTGFDRGACAQCSRA